MKAAVVVRGDLIGWIISEGRNRVRLQPAAAPDVVSADNWRQHALQILRRASNFGAYCRSADEISGLVREFPCYLRADADELPENLPEPEIMRV